MARDLHQSGPARETDDEPPEPPRIRQFRRLVSLLMVVMMVGILAIAGALVWKLSQPGISMVPPVAGDIGIGEGMAVLSISRAGDSLWLLLRDSDGQRWIEERRGSDRALVTRYRLVAEEGA